VPRVAAGAAGELDGLRAACDEAVRRLLAAEPERLYVMGAGERARCHGPGDHGSFAGYGVDLTVRLGPARHSGADSLPLPITVGVWLLGRAGDHPPAAGAQVGPDGAAPPLDLRGRVGLLVMGDGSARRTDTSPGYADPRAAPFDAGVEQALAAGDPADLATLDLGLGAELLAAGVPAWRAAGALLGGGRYAAELLYAGAPYGVGYLVASWVPR